MLSGAQGRQEDDLDRQGRTPTTGSARTGRARGAWRRWRREAAAARTNSRARRVPARRPRGRRGGGVVRLDGDREVRPALRVERPAPVGVLQREQRSASRVRVALVAPRRRAGRSSPPHVGVRLERGLPVAADLLGRQQRVHGRVIACRRRRRELGLVDHAPLPRRTCVPHSGRAHGGHCRRVGGERDSPPARARSACAEGAPRAARRRPARRGGGRHTELDQHSDGGEAASAGDRPRVGHARSSWKWGA